MCTPPGESWIRHEGYKHIVTTIDSSLLCSKQIYFTTFQFDIQNQNDKLSISLHIVLALLSGIVATPQCIIKFLHYVAQYETGEISDFRTLTIPSASVFPVSSQTQKTQKPDYGTTVMSTINQKNNIHIMITII